jgi:hypothetical protein
MLSTTQMELRRIQCCPLEHWGSRASVEALAQDMQQVTGGTVEMAYFAQAVLVRNLRLSQRRTGSS